MLPLVFYCRACHFALTAIASLVSFSTSTPAVTIDDDCSDNDEDDSDICRNVTVGSFGNVVMRK